MELVMGLENFEEVIEIIGTTRAGKLKIITNKKSCAFTLFQKNIDFKAENRLI